MPKNKADAAAVIDVSPCRLVITYADGTWTDNLAAEPYAVQSGRDGTTLTLNVVPRERPRKVRAVQLALAQFAAKRGTIDSILIGAPRFVSRFRACVRESESSEVCVRLALDGAEVVYPGAAVFGPDSITLHLG